ncbi:hypothetical protein GWK47_001290 [Chionoecetes opilio]|uniref:Uncharacterized protein n=1 Tax=Chionoecetes opilio TaxID=41210 RepID=A0A8J4Y102_CHIOP|nr:hypothetical protein GWK47_001290 [Chionoecetes opilio]
MTSTRRRPEDPDDAGFILQRKRFRVTKPSSQQSGATAAERPIPVWRVVRHDDFPSPYKLVRWLECELRLALKVDVSASGEFLLRGATEDAAATLQEVADGQPRGIVLARREPSRRGVLVGYPTGLPLDPVLEHPLVVSAVRCSYSAGLKRHLPTRQVQLRRCGGSSPPPWTLAASGHSRCAGTSRNLSVVTVARRLGTTSASVSGGKSCVVCAVGSTLHGPASASFGRVESGPWLGAPTAVPGITPGIVAALPGSGRFLDPRFLASCSGRRLPCFHLGLHPSPPFHGMKTPP